MSSPLDPVLAWIGSGNNGSAETSAAAPVPSGWRVPRRLNLQEDAHTSSSPAVQDAMGGRIGLLPRPLPKVPSGRAREVVAEETRALAPAPSGGGEGKPLGAWLPLAKVNQAAPYSGALRAPGSGPSPGGCAVPERALTAPTGRCSNPKRARSWCPG